MKRKLGNIEKELDGQAIRRTYGVGVLGPVAVM